MTLTLLALLGGVLAAFTLPLVLELLTLTAFFLLAPRRLPGAAGEVPRLTVVVPAHNEAGSVWQCVQSLRESGAGLVRILVVAHNCSDATAERAVQAGAEVLIYNDIGARGKGHALRYGFKRAIEGGAEAVLVIDADSTISANLIPAVLKTLSEGAAAVQCRYEMLCDSEQARGRLTSLAFRAFTYIRPAGRERAGLSAGISGNGFALTASLLDKVPYEALSVVEDLEYHIHLVMAGEKVRFIEQVAVSSYCAPSPAGEAIQQSRWQGGRLWVAKKWLLPLMRGIVQGRVRLIEPMLDLASVPLAFGVAGLLAACLIPVPWVRIYALASLGVVTLHVITAAWAGPDRAGTLRVLTMTPFYILWKFRLVPGLLRASTTRATWIRTER